MKLGSKILILFNLLIGLNSIAFSDEKIVTTPLINLNELKPSFEAEDENEKSLILEEGIKSKKKTSVKNNLPVAKFIGLDKITAKTSEIIITLGEVKRFGPLEIKVLKCGIIDSRNMNDNVAYLQVKDLSKTQNEKVFIFNGWTFSSDPNLAPFDHAIYDLQLVNCNKI